MKDVINIKALLKLLTVDSGGRTTPIVTGYRPNHVFEYTHGKIATTYIGEVYFDKVISIAPGEMAEVIVSFSDAGNIDTYLNVGRQWFIHEGSRLVGQAEIIELL